MYNADFSVEFAFDSLQIIDFDGGQQRMIAGGFNKRHAFTEEDWVKAESLIRATNNKSKL